MLPVKPRIPNRYLSNNEPFLSVNGDKFIGINTDDDHSTIPPGYFRSLVNLDLFKNDMRTRRGIDVANSAFNYDGVVTNLVVWDIGSDDIAIFSMQNDDGFTRFYYKNLTTLGSFDKIYKKGTGSGEQLELSLSLVNVPDMFVLNNRVYVFTTGGNYVIEYNVGEPNLFTTRTMGMDPPAIDSYTTSSGTMTGEYCFAAEIVYQRDGIDQAASSPNRIVDNIIFRVTLSSQKIRLHIAPSSLPPGLDGYDYWNGLRIYSSRRLDRDTTDPANPIGPFGIDSELYPVVFISRSALESDTYHVDVDVDDSAIDTTEVWQYDRIELSPLPAAYVGTVHKGRIYVSGSPFYSTENESIIYYSNFAGTKYSEQSNALQNIPVAAGDGKKIRKLLSLNNDLIIFKENSTYIAQNGNVDLPPVPIDKAIGVSNHRLAKYIPKLGLVAFSSDNFDIKIFNESLHWTNLYDKLEISRQVRSKAREYAANPSQVSILYINGKLMICNGGGTAFDYVTEVLVLHVEQGKGWTTYNYGVTTAQAMYTFDNDSRAGIITGAGQVPYEIEIFDTYKDYAAVNDGYPINVSLDTWMFQSNNGQDLLEFHKILTGASLDEDNLVGTMYVNGIAWESITNTDFKPDIGTLTTLQRDGIFQLYVSKKPVFPLMYMHMTTKGDIRINMIKWVGIINKDMSLNYLTRMNSGSAPEVTIQPEDETVILP